MTGTILVAEDETIPRKNICRVLDEEGYRVHEVTDGQAALAAIDGHDFDLVLTDLRAKLQRRDGRINRSMGSHNRHKGLGGDFPHVLKDG